MLSKGNILVVDDEVNLCRILDAKLTKSGYEVMTVHDGLQAVEKVQEKQFDLVLLDLILPKLDGLEALQKIRKINSQVPVIIMTACENTEAVSLALSQGASAFVSKPFDLDRLVLLVQNTSCEGHSIPTETTVMMDSTGVFRRGQVVRIESTEKSEISVTARLLERTNSSLAVALRSPGIETSLNVGKHVSVYLPAHDALYRFTSAVQEHIGEEVIHLALPQMMYRIQRREYPRLELKAPVEFCERPAGSRKQAYTEDVGAGGMSIITSTPLDVGNTVDVQARAILHLEQYKCSGRVVRCDKVERGERGFWKVVLTFPEPDFELRRALLQHLTAGE